MELFLTILKIIGIVLLVILAIVLLILIVPVFYEAEVNTSGKNADVDAKIKTILNILSINVQSNETLLILFGFIKIKLKKTNKNDDEKEEKIKEVLPEDKIPEGSSLFRKLKIKAYIFERKIKEASYKFKRAATLINEYKYKMELLKKTVEFIENILKSLKPNKSYIAVTFGTGNSELTGKLMAMAAPWMAKHPKLTLIPNFSESCLNFDVYAKGSVMPGKLVIIALKYWNEDSVKSLRALKKGAK